MAQQASVILASLDDFDVEDAYMSICREFAARLADEDHPPNCDGPDAEISETTLLDLQVAFDVARATADKIAAALGDHGGH